MARCIPALARTHDEAYQEQSNPHGNMHLRVFIAAVLVVPVVCAAQEVTVTATLAPPVPTCIIEETRATLDFGTVTRPFPATADGTVTIDPVTGARTSTQGVELRGTHARALFTVEVRHAATYTVQHNFPAPDALLESVETDGSGAVPLVVSWAATPQNALTGPFALIEAAGYVGTGGGRRTATRQRFALGGTITVAAAQDFDLYARTITATVTCS